MPVTRAGVGTTVETGELTAATRLDLRGVINVKDAAYGAVGDGVANDTTAVLAAIAALPAGGGSIYFPRGSYLLSSRLVVDISNVTVWGEGALASKLVFAAGSNPNQGIRFNSSTSLTPPRLSNCGVRFLGIDFNGGDQAFPSASSLYGAIVAYAIDHVDYDHCRVVNGRNYCFQAVGCTDVDYSHLIAENCYWDGASNPINAMGSATVATRDVEIAHCRVKHSKTLTVSTATASANVATFTTSAAHKLSIGNSGGQPIKVTGCSVAAYNGYWAVASTPTPTTFTVALGATPASSTGGTIALMGDRNIYCGGSNATRVNVHDNLSYGANAACEAEVGDPAINYLTIHNNLVGDFALVGVGAQNTKGVAAIYAKYAAVSNNTVVGVSGTTEFGRAGAGSIYGVMLHGSWLRAAENQVYGVNTGILIGSGAIGSVAEEELVADDNRVYVNADNSNGKGIYVDKTTGTLTGLRLRGNRLYGGESTTTGEGILLSGATAGITSFKLTDNYTDGFYWSGIRMLGCSDGDVLSHKSRNCGFTSGGDQTYKAGIAIDGACSDIRLAHNRCRDTRTPKLTPYGIAVLSGATTIKLVDDDFSANLTAEVFDGTFGAGLTRNIHPEPFVSRAKWEALSG